MYGNFMGDLRYAFRSIRKRPGFAAVSVLVLAIGIGAVTVMYSTLDTVVMQPLPYESPERLIWLWGTSEVNRSNTISAIDYFDYREGCDAFESLASYLTFRPSALLLGEGEPERVPYSLISHNFFATLRVSPRLGRTFSVEEEQAGAEDVVIISHGFWQRKFGGDRGVLGSPMTIDGSPYEVVAVMPPGFDFPREVDFWFPMKREISYTRGRANNNFRIFGRLAEGVDIKEAQAQVGALAAHIAEAYPDDKKGWGIRLESMHEVFFGGYRLAMVVLMAAVTCLLLIACGNISSLSLARASARQNEVALRLALGASRGRIISQLLTESLVIAVIGGALGLALAGFGIHAVVVLGPASLPRLDEIEINTASIVFTTIISLVSGLLFGLLPAFKGSRIGLAQSLKEGGRTVEESTGLRVRSMLVTAQIAVSLMLLICSGLLVRSFLQLQTVDPGFNPENLLLAEIQLPSAQYDTPEKVEQFYSLMQRHIEAIPGVTSVCGSELLPFLSGGMWNYVYPAERPPQTPQDRMGAQRRRVTTGFFRTLGIPILAGRTFDENDRQGAPFVVIISKTMAQEFWPGEEALGKVLILTWGDGIPLEVIGIAGDVREAGPASAARSVFYMPLAQFPIAAPQIALRVIGDPISHVAAIKNALWEFDKNIPISSIHTMESRYMDLVAGHRFRTYLLGVFAVMALLMASMGLYGVLAYFVSQRTYEMGIRMALGADARRVTLLIVRKGMAMAGAGIVGGVILGIIGALVMSSLLFQTAPWDFLTFSATTFCLIVMSLLACIVPARRAVRVDPMIALRTE